MKSWIPIDKDFRYFLPLNRPYTKLEAMVSYTLDMDEKKTISIKGYSRMWDWSRNKVRKFLKEIRTPQGHPVDTSGTLWGHSVTFINKDLWKQKDRVRTLQGHPKDTLRTPTINTNTNNKYNNNEHFEKIWSIYPKKLGRKEAYNHYKYSVKTEKDFENISLALDNYKKYIQDKKLDSQFIKHGSTWFNNWQDWLDYKEPEQQKQKGPYGDLVY